MCWRVCVKSVESEWNEGLVCCVKTKPLKSV